MSNNCNTIEVNEDSDTSVSSNYKHTKRRSEVFQRQSSIFRRSDDVPEDKNKCSDSDNGEANREEPSKEEFDLRKHIEILKFEQEMWKKEYKQRKSQRKLLQKREASLASHVDLDLNILSESEREFLKARPNYAEISKKIEELRPFAIQIQHLNKEINHQNNKLIERIEKKIQKATERIAKHIDKDIVIVV